MQNLNLLDVLSSLSLRCDSMAAGTWTLRENATKFKLQKITHNKYQPNNPPTNAYCMTNTLYDCCEVLLIPCLHLATESPFPPISIPPCIAIICCS